MFDVITVGSATVDVFAQTKTSDLIKIFDARGETDLLAYPIGSKILIEELHFTTGGGATNTAVCFARLGHKVACISKMGSGANANKIKRQLQRDKVATSLLVCSRKGRTGYSIILDSKEHDRTILTYKGSNNDLDYHDIDISKLAAQWFYFSTQLGESFKTTVKLAKYAKQKGIKIAFNASEYLVSKGKTFLREILSRTNIFILNKEEAHILIGAGSIQQTLKAIHKLGPNIVVITDGSKDFYAYDGSCIYSGKPNKAKVVETTGAGDAFAASFVSGMIKKKDISFALKLGAINAESVIQHHGAKNNLQTYKEAMTKIKHAPHIKKIKV
ncbi:MAG TPA: carbohydrate kinase family protein [Candidatus Nanoarchaeia archaeon]|nr:carbohydrate kinase family protein [Candidatus Nanoarchaeia archaeon]